MSNPYKGLDTTKFWRTGVASYQDGKIIENLWQPKYPISDKSKIITLGSCFAQHVSHWLISNGFNWLESEPAPKEFTGEQVSDGGYGVFSFRVGNIYTPALLKQWLAQAIYKTELVEDIFYDGISYHDLFRPQIPINGYENIDQLRSAHQYTIDAIRKSIHQADIFIFTMGLTEAWINNENNVYPVCPGTIKGVFDSSKYFFVNYSHASIFSDMDWSITEIKKINPRIKFLLTVSPVPLTATATSNHVLVANTYSKSVLRNVAEELTLKYDYVDYFPSYELITGPTFAGQAYESNLRNVKPEAVNYVMRHFGASVVNSNSCDIEHNKLLDEVCEDVFLDPSSVKESKFGSEKVCLIGDSHMGMLATAFAKLGVAHCGGMIMNGSAWTSNLLHLDSEEFFVPLESAGARKRWRDLLGFFEADVNDKLVVTNIGMQTHRTVHDFLNYLSNNQITEVTGDVFAKYFESTNTLKLSLLKNLIARDYSVLVVSDPPTRKINQEIHGYINFWEFYDAEALKIFDQIGCKTLNAEKYFSGDKFKLEYFSDVIFSNGVRDWFHGSPLYYEDLAKLIVEQI